MKIIALVLLSGVLLASCSNAPPELKSPCVGGEGSPCDRRAPANQV
ncbi:MAG: hypothetical protein SFX19_04115 [Alphaproteobacteria bacterium]|nr:hypothetical protein [Alphaproteobacteria bacterium]